MLGWKTRQLDCSGSVLFRGSMVPLLENFTQLKPAGVHVRPVGADRETGWAAELEHPLWGAARIVCARNFPPVPEALVQFDPRLSDEDKQAALAAGSAVSVMINGAKQNVLRDRKLLLRFLRCLMGDDALIALDHTGEKFWPREALDDELAHDADLDVESLFVTHLVHEEDQRGEDGRPIPYWAHTHGVAELGAKDFDVLRPAPLLMHGGYDTFRAIAYLLLDGRVGASSDPFPVINPNGEVSFVDVEVFNRGAAAEDVNLRGDPTDPVHNRNRVILCEPRPRGLWRRFRSGRVRPAVILSTIDNDHMTAAFTDSATELMAERARNTFALFRQFMQEFEEFEVKALVKLGYRVDGGGPNDREHMWFEVHSCNDNSVDATLLNQPFNITEMNEGDRRKHDLDRLTDWTIITPAGSINPRAMVRARFIRNNKQKLRDRMVEWKQNGPNDR